MLFLFFPVFPSMSHRIFDSNEVFYHFAYIILLSFRFIFTFFVNLCCLHCVKLRITETLNKNTIKMSSESVESVFAVLWFSLFLFCTITTTTKKSLNLNNNNHSNINPLVKFSPIFFLLIFTERVYLYSVICILCVVYLIYFYVISQSYIERQLNSTMHISIIFNADSSVKNHYIHAHIIHARIKYERKHEEKKRRRIQQQKL